jgi:transposase InsO family protein
LVLVELPVVEQRYLAVRAVLDGARVTDVAAQLGVSRQSVHAWVVRYKHGGLAALADRSHRPVGCPHQCSPEMEALVCELRRAHPRWGAVRILLELKRRQITDLPSISGVKRILARHGLLVPGRRRRRRDQYVRWQRPAPMLLWQMDIVGGMRLVDGETGEIREAKIVTGVDDHSRFCVIAKVVERATGRAVCAALLEAMAVFGAPHEILSDNGKQFTDRFGRGGEVLFDKICRKNGIAHRLTQPSSPTTTGKVERFHQTLRRDFLDEAGPYTSLPAAQAALDDWVRTYNAERPHQALDVNTPVTPSDRFEAVPDDQRDLLPLWTPPAMVPIDGQRDPTENEDGGLTVAAAVEVDRVVPPSGNMWLARQQIWMGPARAGLVVTFWADIDVIHILVAGARIKTLRSHLSTADLDRLRASGARPAGPSPIPPPEAGQAIEFERLVNNCGLVSISGRYYLAAEILGGRQVGVRLDESTLMFFDPSSRQLLRSRPNPGIGLDTARLLRGARPAGPPPRPDLEPVSVQRRVSSTGTICVCRQNVSVGRSHTGRIVVVHVSETTIAVELDDQEVKTVARTTSLPVRNLKAARPYTWKTSLNPSNP